jgi:hypothetical protein
MLNYFTASNSVRWIDILPKLIKNYNNTVNRGIGYTPTEASKGLITSLIIQKAVEKTDAIEAKEMIYHIGDKVRILKKKHLFDKMQTSYSEATFIITKVNKNSVDVENDTHEYKNVKKKWIQKITDVKNHNDNTEKDDVEHYSKVKNKLKQAGIFV